MKKTKVIVAHRQSKYITGQAGKKMHPDSIDISGCLHIPCKGEVIKLWEIVDSGLTVYPRVIKVEHDLLNNIITIVAG